MADGSFIWSTNIAQVAATIDQQLNRIGASVRKASSLGGSSAVGGDLLGGFGEGLALQARRIIDDMNVGVLKAQGELRERIESVGKGGSVGRIDVRKDLLEDPLTRAQNAFADLARQVDLAITGTPLEANRAQLQQALAQYQRVLIEQASLAYSGAVDEFGKLRKQTGVKGLVIAQPSDDPNSQYQQRLAARYEQALRNVELPGATSSDPVARERALAGVTRGTTTDAAQLNRVFKEVSDAVEEEIRTAQRLAAEIRANTSLAGAPVDPGGARRVGNIFVDSQGNRYEATDVGARPLAGENPLLNAVDELRVSADEEAERLRRAGTDDKIAQEREQQIREEAALKRRRAAEIDLEQQLRANRNAQGQVQNVGGAISAGNISRDEQGRIFKSLGADPKTGESRGVQEVVTPFERRQAEKKLAAEEQRILAARRREAKAREAAARAAERDAARAQAGGGGGRRGGVQGVFDAAFGGGGGGGGRGGRGLGFDDILSTGLSFSRYLISAAALGAAFTVLQEVKEAVLDYSDSLADLQVALGGTDDKMESFTASLSEISRFAGENPGAALDQAARGIRAFADATALYREGGDLSPEFVDAQGIGYEFAEGTSQLAVIANKSLEDAAGDLIAVGSVYGEGAGNIEDSFSRINDAIAGAKRIGGDAAEIAQGLAAVAVPAQEAGFSLEETANVISRIQAKTDQSGRAVATRLSRAFSIVGGSAGQSAISRINRTLQPEDRIDTTQSVRNQIEQLAAAYDKLTPNQQGYIRSAAGGAANQREFIAVLKEMPAILEATNNAYQTAGEGNDEFKRKADELNGEIKQIIGQFKSIVVELGKAGFFDIFGAAIEATEPFVTALNRILQAWNEMPDLIKKITALTLQWVAAQKLLALYKNATAKAATTEAAAEGAVAVARQLSGTASLTGAGLDIGSALAEQGGIFRRSPGSKPVMGPVRGSRNLYKASRLAAMQGVLDAGGGFVGRDIGRVRKAQAAFGVGLERLGKASRQAASVMGNALVSGAGQLGRALNFLTTPIGMVGTALAGLYGVLRTYDVTKAILEAENKGELKQGQQVTAENIREVIPARQQAAVELRDSSSGFFGSLSNLLQGRPVERLASQLESGTEAYLKAAEAIEEARKVSRVTGADSESIDVTSAEGIAEGIKLLDESGRSAVTQLDALREAMSRLSRQAGVTATDLTGSQVSEFTNLIGANLEQTLGELENIYRSSALARGSFRERRSDQAFAEVLADVDKDFDPSRLNAIAEQFLANTGGSLTNDEAGVLGDLLYADLISQVDPDGKLGKDRQEQLRGEVALTVKETQRALTEIVDEYAAIDQAIRSALALIQQGAQEVAQNASLSGDPRGGKLAGAEYALQELLRERVIQQANGADELQLQQLDVQIGAARLAVQEAVRAQLEAEADFAKSVLAPSADLERLEIDMERVQDELDVATDADEIRALETQMNDLEFQYAKIILGRTQAIRRAHTDSRDTLGVAQNAVAEAQEAVFQFEDFGDTESEAYWDAVAELERKKLERAAAERAFASAARAASTDPRDNIGNARNALADAIDELRGAKPGTEGQKKALRNVREAQLELADTLRETSQAYRLAAIDPRDTIRVAEEELRQAREDLAATIPNTQANADALKNVRDKELALAAERREFSAAQRRASLDPRASVGNAAADLEDAREALAGAIPDTIEWFERQRELTEMQIAYSDAVIEYASIQRQLDIDLTDPVAVAKEELQKVREKIAAARAQGAPQEVIDGLLVEERNAEAAAEAAAFSQRISDVQTARELGRISHQEYLAYLQEEKERLEAIAVRTRQQQEQLDQVDKLLQAANEELQGQFNLGDINLPTVYEVRRAVAERAKFGTDGAFAPGAVGVGPQTTTNNTTYIQIDGADIAQVEAVLARHVGKQALSRRSATTTRRL